MFRVYSLARFLERELVRNSECLRRSVCKCNIYTYPHVSGMAINRTSPIKTSKHGRVSQFLCQNRLFRASRARLDWTPEAIPIIYDGNLTVAINHYCMTIVPCINHFRSTKRISPVQRILYCTITNSFKVSAIDPLRRSWEIRVLCYQVYQTQRRMARPTLQFHTRDAFLLRAIHDSLT